LTEWHEAENGAWLSSRKKDVFEDDVEKKLFKDMRLTYQSGKGNNHLVPVLIPKDTIAALKLLGDDAIRNACGVNVANNFMFPSTKSSDMHISGWHAVNRVCSDAKVAHPETLTATKMRHRVSTLYASLDVPEHDRHLFYKHMGHSANINATIYQTPLAEQEISKVGRQLQEMDGQLPSTKKKSATADFLSLETNELNNSASSSEEPVEVEVNSGSKELPMEKSELQEKTFEKKGTLCVQRYVAKILVSEAIHCCKNFAMRI
jgi:hypothetical protein